MRNKHQWTPRIVFGTILIAALSLTFPALAQPQQSPQQQQPPAQQPAPAASSQSQAGTGEKSKEEENKRQEQQTGTSNDRLFWTLPNFLTVENASHIPPLTSGQKYKVVARSSFDYVEYPYYAFLSGISQAENSEPGYGQGAAGYGKRYGSAFADGTIENFTTGAILPSLLRQDPRYYQLGEGKFIHRAGYAISRIFVTRTDSGHNQFNYSEVVGSAMSAGISNAYHPAGDRTVANTMKVWWTQIGWDSLAITVREFWPDIRRKLSKRQPHAPSRAKWESSHTQRFGS